MLFREHNNKSIISNSLLHSYKLLLQQDNRIFLLMKIQEEEILNLGLLDLSNQICKVALTIKRNPMKN